MYLFHENSCWPSMLSLKLKIFKKISKDVCKLKCILSFSVTSSFHKVTVKSFIRVSNKLIFFQWSGQFLRFVNLFMIDYILLLWYPTYFLYLFCHGIFNSATKIFIKEARIIDVCLFISYLTTLDHFLNHIQGGSLSHQG